MPEPNQHSVQDDFFIVWATLKGHPTLDPHAALRRIEEQYERVRAAFDLLGQSAVTVEEHERLKEQYQALQLAATRQLTPLDVAATHIAIIRSKGDDYTASERDNVAAIVESHVKEARSALFAAVSNPAKERDVQGNLASSDVPSVALGVEGGGASLPSAPSPASQDRDPAKKPTQ